MASLSARLLFRWCVWHLLRNSCDRVRKFAGHKKTGGRVMVAMNSLDGLIVTTRADASGQLAELSAACGWPTLWAASAREMLRELSLQIPSCVLFWLDDWESVAKTARLIEWLRERHAKPYRIAIACDLGD